VTVTLTPETFSFVFFDPDEIKAIVDRLITEVGLPAGTDVEVRVDESTPLGRARLVSTAPITITVESGALEDVKKPRHLHVDGTIDVLGRLLLEARDRLDPAFGNPPAEDEITLLESSAWQVYCVGRLRRLGHAAQRKRRLYQFRTRHGFNDEVDAAFERLWNGVDLTWDQIAAASADAKAASSAA
jgi:hypothetical protein